MKILRFCDKLKDKIVLLPGCFDGVHQGHRALIKRANEIKREGGARLALLTFDDAFSYKVKGDKLIFTVTERSDILSDLGVDYLIVIRSTKKILAKSYEEFLEYLYTNYNIYSVVCGEDFTFGARASGNVEKLKEYFSAREVSVEIVPDIIYKGEKISSRLIKKMLASGDITTANALLNCEYFFKGLVVHGRNIGTIMGFPTANVEFSDNKKLLKCGVYKTKTLIDGVWRDSITNFGTAPTFKRKKLIIETHVKDFNADIYGKIITVAFIKYIRDIVKFDNVDELVKQLEKDKTV
ncbi:MAG: bifunctional riboflavin kinase/FAD synthetase [Christensenellaceae bacterium]